MKIGSMKSGTRANAQAILANTLARDDDLPSVAELISKRLTEIDIPQTHIARLAGFRSLQMVNMIKSGRHRLPADRIVPLAEAPDIAPDILLRVWFNDYHPAFLQIMEKHVGALLTQKESALINFLREITTSGKGEKLADEAKAAFKNTDTT